MNSTKYRVMLLPEDLRRRAWQALVKELGIVDATRFVMAVEPGEGDSVQLFASMWEGMTLDEVHQAILQAKAQGQI